MEEPLLLLPGMMCDERVFAFQMACLSRGREVRFLSFSEADTIDRLAADLLSRAPWQNFALAGFSMGGIVAIAMASQAPGRILRLGLINSTHDEALPQEKASSARRARRVAAGGLEDHLHDAASRYLAPANRNRGEFVQLIVDMGLKLGVKAYLRQDRALWTRRDQAGFLRDWTRPALVIGGEYDLICPPKRQRRIASLISTSKLVIVRGTGHLPTLEAPSAVNHALAEWLAMPAG